MFRSIDKARLAGATAAKRSRCRGQAGAPGLPSELLSPAGGRAIQYSFIHHSHLEGVESV